MTSRMRLITDTATPNGADPVIAPQINKNAPSWTPMAAGMKNAPVRTICATASMIQASAQVIGR